MSNQMMFRLDGGGEVTAIYGEHHIASGGDGPCAFDYFLASLGSCAGYFISRYCEARDLDCMGISIRQVWHRTDGRVSSVELEVTIPDGFSDKHRKGILAATEQCSVKRLLASPPTIVCTVM